MHDPVAATLAASRWAARLVAARPELVAELARRGPFTAQEIARALEGADGDDETALARRLRRLRQRVLLAVMARDLAGAADLAEVCGTLSDLADAEIACAAAWAEGAFARVHGVPRDRAGRPQSLVVVAMGKLGGRELNASSDVDLVLLYPEEGETDGPRRLSAHEFFDRAGRKLVALLAAQTEDGFAFRTDLRLRPYGDSGPLVMSFEALETYFVTQGREWERYAWLKARPLTGERHAELAAIVRPFVYRKYLDYGALAAMRALHAEVRREVARRELADHIKLGPGGIREIEFIVQALQLVRAGRDPSLAVRATLEALAALGARGLLPPEAARELAGAYVFLRRLEHRLQYLEDAQTHELPSHPAERAHLAAMCGHADWEALAAELAAHRDAVTRHFESLFAGPQEPAGDWPAHARARALRASQRYAQLPEGSRRSIEQLVPAFARAAAETADADATLARAIDLIEAIAGRAAYLTLLAEHPQALARVTRMIGASSWAAEYVCRHPILLDELLDERRLTATPEAEGFEAELRRGLVAAGDDTERQMNVLRDLHHAEVFRLLAQDLAGRLTVERLADHLSALADRVLAVLIDCAWREVRGRHRDTPRFAVIGYGKLGGKELGYASDLDLVFLYDDEDERAPEAYARLAQRLNAWLTTRTTSGILFETDLRLRPSGEAGLLVSSLAAFVAYQERSAWVWEHQALTRARFCAGDAAIGAAFEALRERILLRPREIGALAREVVAMRERIHAAHPNASGLFDLKHDRGGMIDVEFAVQFLVLAHAHAHPCLVGNLGNLALLALAGELGLLERALAERARTAYREFRRLQHALRLNGATRARVPHERVAAHIEAVCALWQAVFGVARSASDRPATAIR